jgi:hypothetical protein
MDNSIKLDVFGRQVLAVRSEEGWQLYYLSRDGKKRSADDLIVPSFITESEMVAYMADLCHERATKKHPKIQRLD